MEKRINRKLAGVVKGNASLTMAKEVPQNNETTTKIASAKREFEGIESLRKF